MSGGKVLGWNVLQRHFARKHSFQGVRSLRVKAKEMRAGSSGRFWRGTGLEGDVHGLGRSSHWRGTRLEILDREMDDSIVGQNTIIQ